ncbi:MAG: sirohydrochlorin cobaltochelatase, partial [Lachnospiraceae bacterium]|nr:sirohydrochlorin cobaltochelatase [Lachnospiraceae bacterium]
FMIVAGDHAENDLAGEEKDSWKSRFEEAGFEVSCILKGLGEYAGVREMFLDHVRSAMSDGEYYRTGT